MTSAATTAMTRPMSVSCRVIGRARATSSATGTWRALNVPRSPCRRPPRNATYRTRSGSLSPFASRYASRASTEAPSPRAWIAGSTCENDITRNTRNVMPRIMIGSCRRRRPTSRSSALMVDLLVRRGCGACLSVLGAGRIPGPSPGRARGPGSVGAEGYAPAAT
ncbi:Uncharacterised protein [Mycobacteroides abscessus]|nr:Uncharacterised protein [Mycobacteroides abscessus]